MLGELIARRVITPASMKMSVLPKYSNACHTFSSASWLTTTGHANLASTSAAATVVSTPLTRASDSPRKKERYAQHTVTAVCTITSECENLRDASDIQPTARRPSASPSSGPAMDICVKNAAIPPASRARPL